mmetsp:Transcript_89135/g.226716  ORF Transcript_89135/g.226716 Transcript_89135/m.226716 type:complete len:302 (-) Transcript_89135:304-1209(-)
MPPRLRRHWMITSWSSSFKRTMRSTPSISKSTGAHTGSLGRSWPEVGNFPVHGASSQMSRSSSRMHKADSAEMPAVSPCGASSTPREATFRWRSSWALPARPGRGWRGGLLAGARSRLCWNSGWTRRTKLGSSDLAARRTGRRGNPCPGATCIGARSGWRPFRGRTASSTSWLASTSSRSVASSSLRCASAPRPSASGRLPRSREGPGPSHSMCGTSSSSGGPRCCRHLSRKGTTSWSWPGKAAARPTNSWSGWASATRSCRPWSWAPPGRTNLRPRCSCAPPLLRRSPLQRRSAPAPRQC